MLKESVQTLNKTARECQLQKVNKSKRIHYMVRVMYIQTVAYYWDVRTVGVFTSNENI